jgi:hypothetical protein
MPAGYSGTPLAKKLGFSDGVSVFVTAMPASVKAEILKAAAPKFTTKAVRGQTAAHLFVTEAKTLAAALKSLRAQLAPNGMVWVSWPKRSRARQSAGAETDISEDAIRKIALPLGYVDVKVCAVDETWSGLKLVIRKSER